MARSSFADALLRAIHAIRGISRRESLLHKAHRRHTRVSIIRGPGTTTRPDRAGIKEGGPGTEGRSSGATDGEGGEGFAFLFISSSRRLARPPIQPIPPARNGAVCVPDVRTPCHAARHMRRIASCRGPCEHHHPLFSCSSVICSVVLHFSKALRLLPYGLLRFVATCRILGRS